MMGNAPKAANMPAVGRPQKSSVNEPATSTTKRTTSPTSQSPPIPSKPAKAAKSGNGSKTGSGRRLACDNCRERKVRCNREQPVCGRCANLGHECRYTTPAKQNTSPTDVSRLLLTLHSRLAQTEARLALNPPLPNTNQAAMNPPYLDSSQAIGHDAGFSNGLSASNTNYVDMQQQFPPTEIGFLDNTNMDGQIMQSDFNSWGNMSLDDDLNMEFNFENTTMQVPFAFDQPVPSVPISPLSTGSTLSGSAPDEEIPLQTLKILHYAYFDVAHHTMPIVNQDRLTAKLSKPMVPPPVASLSYAMASLGASIMDGYAATRDKCYELARKNLEACEREEDGGHLMSIEALQACILIASYELRGKGFARAWMTLGRAIRLAQMMGLDRMDAHPHLNNASKFQQTLPLAQSSWELEERRKAFWVLFIIDAYASVRSGSPVAIDQTKVTTALPSPHAVPDPSQPPMPSLDKAKFLYGTGHLSSFTGLVLMVSLYRRCSAHVKLSLDGEPYSFWEHHYSIDKDIKACIDALIGPLDAQGFLQDEITLALSLNLSAIDICLHEAALVKADKDGLPRALIAECHNRCSEAATRIAESVSLSQKLVQRKKDVFRQMNIYCMWPVCMAMQVLDRQISSVTDHTQLTRTIGVLKLLVTGIKDLDDVSGHWVESISHIVKRLEEMDSANIKSTDFYV